MPAVIPLLYVQSGGFYRPPVRLRPILGPMAGAFQGSLLDLAVQAGPGPLGESVRRRPLAHGAWVDPRPGWLAGADALFDRLLDAVPWRAERRQMYDRVVDVPRLLCFYGEGEALPDPALGRARGATKGNYGARLGDPQC